MPSWEERAKKLERKRRRMNKHGRSLLTAIQDAEAKRAKALKRRAAKASGSSQAPGQETRVP